MKQRMELVTAKRMTTTPSWLMEKKKKYNYETAFKSGYITAVDTELQKKLFG